MVDIEEEFGPTRKRGGSEMQSIQPEELINETSVSKKMPSWAWSLIWIVLGILFLSVLVTQGQNVLGVVGKYISSWLFQFLGMGAWFLSVGLIWIGGYKLVHRGKLPVMVTLGWYGMILCVCVLESIFTKDSAKVGWVGEWLGNQFFNLYLGKVGAGFLAVVGYVCCFIYGLGYKPLGFFKVLYTDFNDWKKRRKDNALWDPNNSYRRLRGESVFTSIPEILEEPELEPEPEAKPKRGKVSKKKLQEVDEREDSLISQLGREDEIEAEQEPVQMDLPVRPFPEIIDASKTKVGKKLGNESFKPALSPAVGEYVHYKLPPLSFLHIEEKCEEKAETDKEELLAIQANIIETLSSFKIPVIAGNITKGPTITRYEVYPTTGLRVSQIASAAPDLARATKAERINVLAPIPGKDTVGIEIANSKRVSVPLRELLEDDAFASSKKKIPVAIGKDVYGNAVIGDLAAMPHLLVAGATGSGKSVCLNSIICSILFRFRPDELRFILADPKVVELKMYEKLPHLIVPVVTDAKKVVGALRWAVNEMEHRYRIFAEVGVRNLEGFNKRPIEEKDARLKLKPEVIEPDLEEEDAEFIEALAASIEGNGYEPESRGAFDEDEAYRQMEMEEEIPDKFPYIVIIVDEFADFMQTASSDMEAYIARLTAKARAAGIHLILATQTPRKDVVTGVIKANIPSRIALSVSSATDSRIILDAGGAEKLIGKGDLLFLPPGTAKLERAQGCFVSDHEIDDIVEHCASQAEQKFHEEIQADIESGGEEEEAYGSVSSSDEADLKRCIEIVKAEQKASTSLLQRRLSIGYSKASRMIDIMQARGYIGPYEGPSKEREIYIQ